MTQEQEMNLEIMVEEIGLMDVLDYLVTFTKRKSEENCIVQFSHLFTVASQALQAAIAVIDTENAGDHIVNIVEAIAQQALGKDGGTA